MTYQVWNNCTILINSCDAYSDVWEPFFRILEKTWPECRNRKIYLNTETKSFSDSYFDIETLNLIPGKGKDIAWGERLLDAVNRIESDYVLMLLEDFFFENRVDSLRVEEAIEIMKNNDRVASICFMTTLDLKNSDYVETAEYSSFTVRNKHVHYTLNASPALWRKKTLVKYTLKHDNPWVWERFGSIRTWYSKDIFLAKKASCPEIFDYDAKRGGAVHRGKWVGCCVRPILDKIGIKIDLDQRGVIEDWTLNPTVQNKRSIKSMIGNKYLSLSNAIRGLFMRCLK